MAGLGRWTVRLCVWAVTIVALSAFPILATAGAVTKTITVSATNVSTSTVGVQQSSPDCRFLRSTDPGERSDYCVQVVPLTILIRSNTGWSAAISARDSASPPGKPSVKSSALRFGLLAPVRYSDAASSPHLSDKAMTLGSGRAAGSQYSLYFYVRVNHGDDLASFSPIVTISVSSPGGGIAAQLVIRLGFHPVG